LFAIYFNHEPPIRAQKLNLEEKKKLSIDFVFNEKNSVTMIYRSDEVQATMCDCLVNQ